MEPSEGERNVRGAGERGEGAMSKRGKEERKRDKERERKPDIVFSIVTEESAVSSGRDREGEDGKGRGVKGRERGPEGGTE